MKQNLRRVLLATALAGLSLGSVRAFDWLPVGTSVDANGFACFDGGVYVGGDIITDSTDLAVHVDADPTATFNASMVSSLTDSTLNIYGNLNTNDEDSAEEPGGGIQVPLKVSRDVTIDASAASATVNVYQPVIIEPLFDEPVSPLDGDWADFMDSNSTPSGTAHIQFITADDGSTNIVVNAYNDVVFRGKNAEDFSSKADMLISFVGGGKTTFRMSGGVKITFDGNIDTSSPVAVDQTTGLLVKTDANYGVPSSNAGGTKVFVCLDQADASAHKVVFQRGGLNDAADLNTTVEVGANSLITFLSNDRTGASDSTGHSALAFDPSNSGLGRMVLFIRGAYDRSTEAELLYPGTESESINPDYAKVTAKYPFNDGAVVVAGHYVDSDFATPGDIRRNYDLSTPAGVSAVLRVIDDQYYSSLSGSDIAPYAPGASVRRGLLVVNDVQSHGKLMADPYWDKYAPSSLETDDAALAWLPSNPDNAKFNCRRGFVLGVNGVVDIYHNTFLDHASGSVNDVDPLAYNIFASTQPYLLKQRNPSAFIVDGIDPDLFLDGNPSDSDALSLFTVADPRVNVTPMRAKVNLRGSGALYLKHAGSSNSGNLLGFYDANPDGTSWDIMNWTTALAMLDNSAEVPGTLYGATYDGINLSSDDLNCASVPTATTSGTEGLHVFDAEGELSVVGSAAADAADARTYDDTTSRGVMNAAGIQIDYRGLEVNGDDGLDLERPLAIDGTTYVRYNKPCLFFNNNVAFDSVTLSHSAATHYVDGVPLNSEPAITGGERFWFNTKVWDGDPAATTFDENVILDRTADANRFRLPEIQFYNSTLALHESLNASGVRFVTADSLAATDATANNSSTVQFFDHGDVSDTNWLGWGRIFLCGSLLNTMSDGTNNFVTESCPWNIYKHNVADDAGLDASSTVALNLTNGDEFGYELSAAAADKQRAHHLFLFAQPASVEGQVDTDGDVLSYAADLVIDGKDPVCNLSVGWPALQVVVSEDVAGANAPAADAGNYPYILPYPSWSNEPLLSDMSNFAEFVANPFVPDALRVPAAQLNVKGSVICFGSFDKDGNSIDVPVIGDDVSGVVYVKHGGKMNMGVSDGGIYGQSVFATMLCQRLWNDYNNDGTARVCAVAGQVNLPSDQVTFDTNYAVQPYNLSSDMFGARRDETHGYVRMSGYNAGNALNDRAGIPQMLVGWFNRDIDADAIGDDYATGNLLINEGTKKKAAFKNSPAHKAIAKMAAMRAGRSRSVNSITEPQERPLDLLYVGPGDDIKQLRVAGATMSDPFMLSVSGDGIRPLVARVREFVSQQSQTGQITDHFISEGSHAALFVEYGGRVGLGSRSWNEHSLNAWNMLGKDNVTICPLGDGVVDVNSNLVVTDRQALIATPDFGYSAVNRITFFSQEPREIRIPAGGELDLSSFGQAPNQQQIAFGGNISLVFEDGATLRMPNDDVVDGGVVLYFNDQAKLVFEGDQAAQNYVPFSDLTSSSNTAPAKDSRTRILGSGQIWANKDAEINVNGHVFVGVESDASTPVTNITISLQRQGSMNIGSDNIGGGAFQVGNPDNVSRTGQSVSFNLTLNGPNATFHIDREGFFGLGAGVINKFGVPNGSGDEAPSADLNPVLDDVFGTVEILTGGNNGLPMFTPVQVKSLPTTGGHYAANYTALSSGVWLAQPLYNVASITVDLQNGIFEHKNIADGNASDASLMAVGPAEAFNWTQAGASAVSVRGGGNLMLVPAADTDSLINPNGYVAVNIWDYAGQMANDTVASVVLGSGESYNIMASGPALLDKNIAGINDFTTASSFFNFVGATSVFAQAHPKVSLGGTAFADRIAYVDASATNKYADVTQGLAGTIVRQSAPAAIVGSSMEAGLEAGSLDAIDQGGGALDFSA